MKKAPTRSTRLRPIQNKDTHESLSDFLARLAIVQRGKIAGKISQEHAKVFYDACRVLRKRCDLELVKAVLQPIIRISDYDYTDRSIKHGMGIKRKEHKHPFTKIEYTSATLKIDRYDLKNQFTVNDYREGAVFQVCMTENKLSDPFKGIAAAVDVNSLVFYEPTEAYLKPRIEFAVILDVPLM